MFHSDLRVLRKSLDSLIFNLARNSATSFPGTLVLGGRSYFTVLQPKFPEARTCDPIWLSAHKENTPYYHYYHKNFLYVPPALYHAQPFCSISYRSPSTSLPEDQSAPTWQRLLTQTLLRPKPSFARIFAHTFL